MCNLNVDREGVEVHLTDEGNLARHRIHHLVVTVNPHTCKFDIPKVPKSTKKCQMKKSTKKISVVIFYNNN